MRGLMPVIVLNDLSRHHAPLRAALDAAIARVQDRGHYILGPEVEAFEREFAAYCGAASCVGVANGTDALELALRALDIGVDDEVATVANAGGYATTVIRAVGATPLYVDIDEATLLIDPDSLARRITPRTRAIVITHLYGRLADVDAIAAVAKVRGLALIEDCAQAHGARHGTKKAGTFGVVGCFSFYPTKNLGALGDAGALVTNDAALAAKIKELRTYGWRGKYRIAVGGGMNSRMDELQAAVLRVKLPHLDAWNQRRREIASRYATEIANPRITLPPAAEAAVTHLYVVRAKLRDVLRAHLAEAGVVTDIHYPIPDYRQAAWPGDVPAAGLERTDRACAEILTLPCYPELTDPEIAAVAAACNSWRPATRS
ncbi:MAG: DegT/DnrJ/EryC1/StrS family aminotransferase [Casimicrobiaceae bacterium]